MSPRLTGSELLERVVRLEQVAQAAHRRIDERDQDIRDIKAGIADVSKELKDVIAWMNRGKGWAAATMLMSGLIGAALSHMAARLFKA